MTTLLIISFLFGLLCVWLLKRTKCINTQFIAPYRDPAHRVHLRKTRRGWMGFSQLRLPSFGFRLLDRNCVAANIEVADPAAALKDEEKDAMLRELLDLAHNATDADVRSTFSAFAQEGESDEEKAENAKVLARHAEACAALGLAANATPEDIHAAILAVPTKLKAEKDLASNEKKARSTLLLDVAINSGRILQSQRSVYETAFGSDFDGTARKLADEGPKLNTTALQLQHRKELAANTRDIEAQIEVAVNELMAEPKNLTYRQAWNAVKADQKFKAFFSIPQPETAVS